jgi:hypothetical protein
LKKVISAILFIVLLTPIVVTYSAFKLRQQKIHKSIKRQIKKGASNRDLVLLKVSFSLEKTPSSDFQRIHSKEFRYKGEMYDIVEQETRNDTTFYLCIWDKEETALFANLDKLILRAVSSDPFQKQENQKLISFFKLMFCEEIKDYFILNAFINKHHNLYLNLYKSPIPGKSTPPPEYLV